MIQRCLKTPEWHLVQLPQDNKCSPNRRRTPLRAPGEPHSSRRMSSTTPICWCRCRSAPFEVTCRCPSEPHESPSDTLPSGAPGSNKWLNRRSARWLTPASAATVRLKLTAVGQQPARCGRSLTAAYRHSAVSAVGCEPRSAGSVHGYSLGKRANCIGPPSAIDLGGRYAACRGLSPSTVVGASC
jgi:hypothetical protein